MLQKMVNLLVSEYGIEAVLFATEIANGDDSALTLRVDDAAKYEDCDSIKIARVKVIRKFGIADSLREAKSWVEAQFKSNGAGAPIIRE